MYNMSTMLNIFRKVLLVEKNNEVDYMFVFLSHNFKDKDIIEPIAVRIAGVYGKENVFMTLGQYNLEIALLIK